MTPSGFVLAGGKSRRMGQDKALLAYRGSPLAVHIARMVQETLGAAAPVTIVGDPDCYRDLGYPVHADLIPDCGPLGGVVTALHLAKTDWSLIVACDMPMLDSAGLRQLVERAAQSQEMCVAAQGASREPEPLCAVYHRRSLPVLERALSDKRLKMMDLLSELRPETVAFPAAALANINTPEEWNQLQAR